ncbi:hypothetical protein R6242_18785 [Iodobacter sp. CM08]|uniref:hypothetical protein n=1 Tax=Iodobacter sp. CM08 TaxID=3085902 RepID=UPI0029811484|nr:hypothetical protein [Iodobacter sp. CM08]MDW5418615.1 hypothetical protein [Iodobacter sp. CM08]
MDDLKDSEPLSKAHEQKKPSKLVKYHRAHVKVVSKIVNVDGAKSIASMAKKVGKSAVSELCPRCGIGLIPAWENKDECCAKCGYIRVYEVTADRREELLSQFDHLTIDDVNNILKNHRFLTRFFYSASIACLLLSVGFIFYDAFFYSSIFVMMSLAQVTIGLKHSYYHWLIVTDHMFVPNKFSIWIRDHENSPFWPVE